MPIHKTLDKRSEDEDNSKDAYIISPGRYSGVGQYG